MKSRGFLGWCVALALGVVTFSAPAMAVHEASSHLHVDHVLQSWTGTPGERGLLPTALAESAAARRQAELALERSDDLDGLKLHLANVLYAVNPALAESGSGLGYGLRPAAAAIGEHLHLGYAVAWEDVSENQKNQVVRLSASVSNVLMWADELAVLGREVEAASDPTGAAQGLRDILGLVKRIAEGFDANGDGEISWEKGEGGLAQIAEQMRLMLATEGST
ncbi:MAG: hypothetical protein IH905_14680 [Proteobacteria bacterium]|nr:hypothetical protein [Pseudomonadota bacterium]